ncbi:ABC transporter permease [Adhaeribacter pallidiroseus]|uniref:Macrolide export ATP-binding/permease protein MacB n=1 Tax=Adhaeribacter pallidiroseus TaxID=2072847 RepID=A0A369QWG6_9BACT|nr:ABC transporter permease [Adhaeribacter pallidiroseus]RDC66498.1 Macrolide export ATP-binding/permease protein MacB [Adhaeribacter pallidiroseus]
MLKNYLKIAWKVLLRRKFFTFISLFGISFTLMILMVATAMVDHLTGSHTPETRMDRTLFINFNKMTNEAKGSMMNSVPSYYYLQRYVMPMKTPEKVAIGSTFKGVNSYVNNKRLSLDLKYTDANFWEILEFNFLEGKAFNQQNLKNADKLAVITDYTRDQYFGVDVPAVGKYIVVDGVRYQVCGVVEDVPISRFNSYANVWVPLSTSHINKGDISLFGEHMAIILARKSSDIPKIQAEYQHIVKQIKVPDPQNFDRFGSYAEGILEGVVVRQLFGSRYGDDSGMGKFVAVVSLIVLLFMLMPTINLVNINVSRILERSSEIGVRKAFGASSRMLIGQFLVENIFLTLLGGLLGFLLSAVALQLISSSGIIPYAQLTLNWRVFAVGIGLSLVFGLLSGVIPAYKMSKLQAVEALKGGQL